MISIYDLKKFRLFLLSVLFLISAVVSSQNLTFKGYTKVEDKPLQNVTIKVKVGPKVIDEFLSDEKGFFSTSLPFNFNYTIYFEKAGFCIMHADIKGAVPDEKSEYKIKYEITIPFYTVRNQSINENN